MQGFSVLQLLKVLSAVSASDKTSEQIQKSEENQDQITFFQTSSTTEKPNNAEGKLHPNEFSNDGFSRTHARKEAETAVCAYENFLSQHEKAVRRVENKTEK